MNRSQQRWIKNMFNTLEHDERFLSGCKKASMKPSALVQLCHFLIFEQKDEDKVSKKYCVESQLSYYPVIWMFVSKKVDKSLSCQELLRKGGSNFLSAFSLKSYWRVLFCLPLPKFVPFLKCVWPFYDIAK